MLTFSIVIPIYNEEESIKPLYLSLAKVMDKLERSYEIIFVNDGSKDKSLEVLSRIESKAPHLVIINLSKHYGKSTALQAGFDNARGELIITMDGDLQNDPEDIPHLLGKINDGYDVVCGWRHNRKDPGVKVFASKIATTVRKTITKENIHDVGCPLRIFKKECIKDIYLSGNLHRFFTFIMFKLGYKIGEMQVAHRTRSFGRTKYNIQNRLFSGIIDLTLLCLCDIHTLTKRKPNYEIKEIITR